MDTQLGMEYGRDGPPAKERSRGSFAGQASTPDQPPSTDAVFFYANASPGASQFAAGADAASPDDQGHGPDAPVPGSLGTEDAGKLAGGFPPDDGPVLWQGDLGVQGRFRTRVRVIGLEDGGQRARLLKELVFRPSGSPALAMVILSHLLLDSWIFTKPWRFYEARIHLRPRKRSRPDTWYFP